MLEAGSAVTQEKLCYVQAFSLLVHEFSMGELGMFGTLFLSIGLKQ